LHLAISASLSSFHSKAFFKMLCRRASAFSNDSLMLCSTLSQTPVRAKTFSEGVVGELH